MVIVLIMCEEDIIPINDDDKNLFFCQTKKIPWTNPKNTFDYGDIQIRTDHFFVLLFVNLLCQCNMRYSYMLHAWIYKRIHSKVLYRLYSCRVYKCVPVCLVLQILFLLSFSFIMCMENYIVRVLHRCSIDCHM